MYTQSLKFTMLCAFACYRMLYGLFTNNYFPLLTTYGTGEFLAIIYVSVYFTFTEDKTYALKAIGVALLFIGVVSAYALLGWQGVLGQSVDDVGNVIGFIGIGIVIVLYSSPFETLMQVLRTKSSHSMPILMIAAGTFSNALWTLYAFLDDQLLIAITNVTCLVFGAVQVTLYLMYRPRRGKVDLPDSLEILTPTYE